MSAATSTTRTTVTGLVEALQRARPDLLERRVDAGAVRAARRGRSRGSRRARPAPRAGPPRSRRRRGRRRPRRCTSPTLSPMRISNGATASVRRPYARTARCIAIAAATAADDVGNVGLHAVAGPAQHRAAVVRVDGAAEACRRGRAAARRRGRRRGGERSSRRADHVGEQDRPSGQLPVLHVRTLPSGPDDLGCRSLQVGGCRLIPTLRMRRGLDRSG